jgi:hypothetical protein
MKINPAVLPASVQEAANIHTALLRLQRQPVPYTTYATRLRLLIQRRQALPKSDRDTEYAIDALLTSLSSQLHTAAEAREFFTIAARSSKAASDIPSQWLHKLRAALETRIIEALDDPAFTETDMAALLSALSMAQQCHSPSDISAATDGAVSHHFLVHHG